MPQMTNLVLKDRRDPNNPTWGGTGVDHTFKPQSVKDGVTTFVESTGTPIGDRRISFSQARTANGRVKVTMKIAIPVVQDVNVGGVTKPSVVRTAYADLTLNYDATSQLRERDDLVGFIVNALKVPNDTTLAYVVDLEGFY